MGARLRCNHEDLRGLAVEYAVHNMVLVGSRGHESADKQPNSDQIR